MRIVQTIQAAAALTAAIIITFLQPQRDAIGVTNIGLYGLLAVSIGWAISHVVQAFVQKRMRAYISHAIILVAFGFYFTLLFDAKNFITAATALLVLGGATLLLIAIAHRNLKKVFRDNLITAIIWLVAGLVILLVPTDSVTQVGLLNTAMIFTAVHLGIAAASPKV